MLTTFINDKKKNGGKMKKGIPLRTSVMIDVYDFSCSPHGYSLVKVNPT